MTEPKYKKGGKYKVNIKVVINNEWGMQAVSNKSDFVVTIINTTQSDYGNLYDLLVLDPNMETFLGKPLTDSVMLARGIYEDMIDKLNPQEITT